MIRLKVQETSQRFRIITETPVNFNVESGIPLYPEEYTGSYEVTPSETEQTLETEGLMMTDDVTIGAIQTETKSVNPTESEQTVTHTSGKYMTEVTVGAIDSEYVGSDVPRRDETDLSASGATVTVPAGYYAEQKTKSVASGTAGIPTATKGAVSNHSISVTPSVTNTSGYITGSTKTGTAVTVSASELVSGNKNITQSGSTDVTNYATATVPEAEPFVGGNESYFTENGQFKWRASNFIEVDVSQGDKEGWLPDGYHQDQPITKMAIPSGTTITPSTSSQTIGGANFMLQGAVTVSAMPSGVLGDDGIDTEYYTQNNKRKWRARGWLDFGSGGWVDDINYTSYYSYNAVPSGTTITPSTSSQTVGGSNYMMEGAVTVNAMPSMTLPSQAASTSTGTYKAQVTSSKTPNDYQYLNIPTGYNGTAQFYEIAPNPVWLDDLTVNGSGTYNAGYYDLDGFENVVVPSGTAGTPALTVSAVENHSKTIRSSVINQTGWITGGTVSGASTTVSASDLVSGSQNITANANNIDVTNLASVNVQVPSGSPSLQTKSKTYTPTTTQQTESVTADNGYDGLDTVNVTVNAMPSGSVTAPSSITGTGSTVSTSTNTLTLSKTVSVTPNVTTAGYVSSGTAGNSSVSLSASVTTKGAATYRASTTQQTIASGTYLTGVQTIAPVSQTNLTAENIKSGTTISISDGANNIWSVTGTYSGGGGSSNWTLLGTKDCGTISTSSTTAATINKDFSVSGVGDYDLLVVETSVNTKTNGRHAATARLIWLTAGSTIGTKNGATIATATWNVKLSSSGVATSRASTTPRGIYPYSCTVSTTNNVTSAAIVMYSCYNSTQTGTINGTYTARVYGVKLYDLIGG